MAVVTTNLGTITAYGDAVAAGYTGTKAQWQALMANYATVGQQAAQDAQTASQAAQTATTKAGEASQSATAAAASAASITTPDATLTQAGVAADAKATGDKLSELKEDLTAAQVELAKKAETDGYYKGMTVGDAEQLVASQYVEDSVPYQFRTTGGSADVGNREYVDAIVGGAVAWNQRIKNGNFADNSYWSGINATFTISGGVASVTASAQWGRISQNYADQTLANHKYFVSAYVYGSPNIYVDIGYGSKYLTKTNEWEHIAFIATRTEDRWDLFAIGDKRTSGWTEYKVKDVFSVDLTALFGATIADYIYSLEQATAGAGVAWFRQYFGDAYYPYSALTLKSVEGLIAHEMVGFNQWDEVAEAGTIDKTTGEPISTGTTVLRSKNFIHVLSGKTYFANVRNLLEIFQYDSNKGYIGNSWVDTNGLFTVGENCSYIKFRADASYGTTYNHDICINLSDPKKNGEYEPYTKHTYPLDSSLTLRGIPKLDAANKFYYDGDTYVHDGTVTRRYGVVDLGSVHWNGDANYFYSSVGDKAAGNFNIICSKYPTTTSLSAAEMSDKQIKGHGSNNAIYIKDSSYASGKELKAALSGVMCVYELATPTTETADPYQHIQVCDDLGTEKYVSTSIVSAGHNTRYPANLRDKLQHLPDLADNDGYYMINQVSRQMSLERFRIPKAPTVNGIYTLKATVSGGTPTYTWEAQT